MTVVYRLTDALGDLLYVGISDDWLSRMKQHRKEKEWWHEVATVAVSSCASREQAERLEVEAIKVERPKYNVMHVAPPPAPSMPPVVLPDQWRLCYSAAEAARILRLPKHRVSTDVATGRLPSVTLGTRTRRILAEDLMAYSERVRDQR